MTLAQLFDYIDSLRTSDDPEDVAMLARWDAAHDELRRALYNVD